MAFKKRGMQQDDNQGSGKELKTDDVDELSSLLGSTSVTKYYALKPSDFFIYTEGKEEPPKDYVKVTNIRGRLRRTASSKSKWVHRDKLIAAYGKIRAIRLISDVMAEDAMEKTTTDDSLQVAAEAKKAADLAAAAQEEAEAEERKNPEDYRFTFDEMKAEINAIEAAYGDVDDVVDDDMGGAEDRRGGARKSKRSNRVKKSRRNVTSRGGKKTRRNRKSTRSRKMQRSPRSSRRLTRRRR
jgi:hypothetical protein